MPSAQEVIDGLWVLHHEKLKINERLKSLGSPQYILDEWIKAMNLYRDAWHSARARVRDQRRLACASAFKNVEQLIQDHAEGKVPPVAGVKRRRTKRQR